MADTRNQMLDVRDALIDAARAAGMKSPGAGVSTIEPFEADFDLVHQGRRYNVVIRQRGAVEEATTPCPPSSS